MTAASIPLPARPRRLRRDEEGQGLAEYALILALASLVCVGSLATLGESLSPSFRQAADTLRAAAR
jgi:Flp pilus assembly pilin Flp